MFDTDAGDIKHDFQSVKSTTWSQLAKLLLAIPHKGAQLGFKQLLVARNVAC